MIGATGVGKTHLTAALIDELTQPRGPYKVIFISKKGFDVRPGGKVIQGEVITDRREIEGPPDGAL